MDVKTTTQLSLETKQISRWWKLLESGKCICIYRDRRGFLYAKHPGTPVTRKTMPYQLPHPRMMMATLEVISYLREVWLNLWELYLNDQRSCPQDNDQKRTDEEGVQSHLKDRLYNRGFYANVTWRRRTAWHRFNPTGAVPGASLR